MLLIKISCRTPTGFAFFESPQYQTKDDLLREMKEILPSFKSFTEIDDNCEEEIWMLMHRINITQKRYVGTHATVEVG